MSINLNISYSFIFYFRDSTTTEVIWSECEKRPSFRNHAMGNTSHRCSSLRLKIKPQKVSNNKFRYSSATQCHQEKSTAPEVLCKSTLMTLEAMPVCSLPSTNTGFSSPIRRKSKSSDGLESEERSSQRITSGNIDPLGVTNTSALDFELPMIDSSSSSQSECDEDEISINIMTKKTDSRLFDITNFNDDNLNRKTTENQYNQISKEMFHSETNCPDSNKSDKFIRAATVQKTPRNTALPTDESFV